MDSLKRDTKTNRVTGFDVTCVIGSVMFGDTGEETAEEAAFKLIARHGTEGVFNFPHEDGRTVSVAVDYIDTDRTQEDK